MAVICLAFPRLAVELVRRRFPRLAGQPVAVLDGHGEDARIIQRSPEAACAGVLVGMTAGQARARAPWAAFVPMPAAACTEETDRLGYDLAARTGLRFIGRDTGHVWLAPATPMAPTPGIESYARQLAEATARETGYLVAAGVGETAAEAAEAAVLAARRARVSISG